MGSIHDLVSQALKSGYLSLELEREIQQVYNVNCSMQDVEALVKLQQAVQAGYVKRQMQEILHPV
jgi:hypothetical protein